MALSLYIVVAEYRDAKPDHWWRRTAEWSLTRVSHVTTGALSLTAAKTAFRLRMHLSADETLRALVTAAQAANDNALASVALAYFTKRSPSSEAMALAREAFDLSPNEMTAWQLVSRQFAADSQPDRAAMRLLLNGELREYAALLRISPEDSRISQDVIRYRSVVDDERLVTYAEAARRAEAEFEHWSSPEVRAVANRQFRASLADVSPIARQNKFFAFVRVAFTALARRNLESLQQLFADPDPVSVAGVTTSLGRRINLLADAVYACVAAENVLDQIDGARRLEAELIGSIYALESGELLNEYREQMSIRRNAVRNRLNQVRGDVSRYRVGADHVAKAIEGLDANEAFVLDARVDSPG